jgi:hypothetical protein
VQGHLPKGIRVVQNELFHSDVFVLVDLCKFPIVGKVGDGRIVGVVEYIEFVEQVRDVISDSGEHNSV